MKINTLRFGELEITESQCFTFPMGILGFSSFKKFVIIDQEESSPFKWMQSVEDPSTAFVLSDPLLFYPTYCAEIKRTDLTPLDSVNEDNLILSVIMTVTDNIEELSANLCAPLIFNLANRSGMQYVLNDRRYPVKYYLFQEDSTSSQKAHNIKSVVGESRGDTRSLSLR